MKSYQTRTNPNNHPTKNNTDDYWKFSGTCFGCNEKGHKDIDCQTRKQEIAQNDPTYTDSIKQRPQRADQSHTRDNRLEPRAAMPYFWMNGYLGTPV